MKSVANLELFIRRGPQTDLRGAPSSHDLVIPYNNQTKIFPTKMIPGIQS